MNADRRRLALAALAGFLFAVAAFAPAGLVAAAITRASPLAAIAGAEGSVWRGRLKGYSHNGVLIGDVSYRLHALPLLIGRLSFDVTSENGALLGAARVRLSPGSAELRDVSATFNLGAIRRYTFFGVRYQGSASLKAGRIRMARAACASEEAAISTTAFDALARRWSGGAFPMTGSIDCREGALVATLKGEGADGAATVTVTLRPDFMYGLTVAARPRRPEVRRALEAFGFEKRNDGLSYEATGALKGLTS